MVEIEHDREGWGQIDDGCIELRIPAPCPEVRSRIGVSTGPEPCWDALIIDTSSTGGRFDSSVQLPIAVLGELLERYGYRLERDGS